MDDMGTLRESSRTIKEPGGAADFISGTPSRFRGWDVAEQLPTNGAEADIYILSSGGERRILKLYRYSMEPKAEVLRHITEISRRNSGSLVTFYETGYDETTERWYELQEYIPFGSLLDIPLETQREHHFISQLVPELSEAIKCLHDNGVIHCDIKPSNVLIRSVEPLDLVLADFGIASILNSDEARKMTSLKGTPMYWAPEAFSRSVGYACDWWGFGMILLELLTGEHPFEGMSYSRIIHRLTVSNVEVPGFLGPEWGMLLKGLLTKDDSKRWGYGEVTRWYAGARDIPVYYEMPSRDADAPEGHPFNYNGVDYHSLEELAEALAADETPWRAAADIARFLRVWLESRGDFGGAAELAAAEAESGPETALFRFIHSNAALPFCAFGHVIDANNMLLFLTRNAQETASDMENRILEMLDRGRLPSLYEKYARLRGADSDFRNLLRLLSGKPREFQLAAIGVSLRPELYLWPEDAAPAGDIESAFAKIGGAPLQKEELDILREKYVLPATLTEKLKTAATYREAADILTRWKGLGILIPASYGQNYRAMSAAAYEAAAHDIILGHTPGVMESLEFATGELKAVHKQYQYLPEMGPLLEWLAGLRSKKITPKDTGFINEISEIMSGIRQSEQGLFPVCGIWGACGAAAGVTLCLFLIASGIIGHTVWTIIAITAVFANLVLIGMTFSPYDTYRGRGYRERRRRRLFGTDDGYDYDYDRDHRPRGIPSLERYLRRRYGVVWVLLLPLLLGSISASKGDLWELTNNLGPAANLIFYAVFGAIFGATYPAAAHFTSKWTGVYTILNMWSEHRSE